MQQNTENNTNNRRRRKPPAYDKRSPRYRNQYENNDYAQNENYNADSIIYATKHKKRKNRRDSLKAVEAGIFIILATVLITILVIAAMDFFFGTVSDDDISSSSSLISENKLYSFGEFDGFVTIGDNTTKVYELLGLPDYQDNGYIYYGSAYVFVENDIVTGYHLPITEDLKITIGFKESDSPILRGDSALKIVKKLGSPNTYSKEKWVYDSVGENFASKTAYSGQKGKLTLYFDESYCLEGYTFSK